MHRRMTCRKTLRNRGRGETGSMLLLGAMAMPRLALVLRRRGAPAYLYRSQFRAFMSLAYQRLQRHMPQLFLPHRPGIPQPVILRLHDTQQCQLRSPQGLARTSRTSSRTCLFPRAPNVRCLWFDHHRPRADPLLQTPVHRYPTQHIHLINNLRVSLQVLLRIRLQLPRCKSLPVSSDRLNAWILSTH